MRRRKRGGGGRGGVGEKGERRRRRRVPEEGLEVLHAGVVALLQLVLVRLLVLLDELAVPLQGVARLLEEVLEAQPQLVLVLAGHLGEGEGEEED